MATKILLIENNKADHDKIHNLLLELNHSEKDIISCTEVKEAFTVPEGQILAILVSAALARTGSVEAVTMLQAKLPATPVLMLASFDHNEDSIATIHNGAQDYLLKPVLDAVTLGKAILFAVERKRILNELLSSVVDYRSTFTDSPCPMWIFDVQTLEFLDVNIAALKIYGYTKEEFLKMKVRDIRAHEDLDSIHKLMARQQHLGLNDTGIWGHVKKDKGIVHVRVYSHLTHFQNREARTAVLIPLD